MILAEGPMTQLNHATLLAWLCEQNPQRLELLWQQADAVRRQFVGAEIHLRGLIEISNHCRRNCHYCGLRAARSSLPRYRLSDAEIAACVNEAQQLGCGTVVLQAGEDPGLDGERMSRLISWIKQETPLAVTLSLGERTVDELACWRRAGADRYLLRFETGNPALFAAIHPGRNGGPSHPVDRLAILRRLRELGYEIGSGVMIGIPGQTYRSLVDDLLLFRRLDLDMVGNGPFIAHPDTPLGQASASGDEDAQQVPDNALMAYKVLALTRLLCPEANIPYTTALASLSDRQGMSLGFSRGANVIMPCLTPAEYQEQYEPYPGKLRGASSAEWCREFQRQTTILDRKPGVGAGPRMTRAGSRQKAGKPACFPTS